MAEHSANSVPLRQFWTLLARYLRPHWRWVVALGALLSGSIGLQLLAPQIMRRFIDGAGDPSVALEAVLTSAGLYIGVALAQQICAVLAAYAGQRVAWRSTNALREDLALHCLHLDMAFHNRHSPGEMIERLDGDVAGLASFFSQFSVLILGNLLLLAGTLVAFALEDGRLGLVMVGYAALTLGLLARLHQVATPHWRAARAIGADFFGFFEECLVATLDLRALGAAPYALRRLHRFTERRLIRELRASLINLRIRYVDVASYSVGQILTVAAGYYLYRELGASIGTAAMLVFYMDLLHRPLRQLTEQIEELQRAGASVGRVGEWFAEEQTIRTTSPVLVPKGPLAVQFERVSFGYGAAAVLDDISFAIPAGSVLGVLGRTGSGKTTLARLLARLYDPQRGAVRLGGVELTRLAPEGLRAQLALVPQSPHLFSGTVRDNLTLFETGYGDAALEEAIGAVGLGDWFGQLPQGLDTRLTGERGGLAAGEAQLLVLARAFLRDPGLVVLDEATARLDPATETRLGGAVDALLRGRTGMVIAHRLSAVQRADHILILEQGRVVEWGPRASLAASPSSRYARLLRTGLGQESQ